MSCILCYVMSLHAMSCHVTSCEAMQYYVMSCHDMLCSAILCHIVRSCDAVTLFYVILYCVIILMSCWRCSITFQNGFISICSVLTAPDAFRQQRKTIEYDEIGGNNGLIEFRGFGEKERARERWMTRVRDVLSRQWFVTCATPSLPNTLCSSLKNYDNDSANAYWSKPIRYYTTLSASVWCKRPEACGHKLRW